MRSIAIDANLLILLVVGLTDRNLVASHKKTKEFDLDDFDQLIDVLATFQQIVVTSNVLTETSNLVSYTSDYHKRNVLETLAGLIEIHREEFVPSIRAAKRGEFFRLGLTDCALLDLVGKEMPLITVDLDLYLAASRNNSNVVNFNHLRQARLMG